MKNISDTLNYFYFSFTSLRFYFYFLCYFVWFRRAVFFARRFVSRMTMGTVESG